MPDIGTAAVVVTGLVSVLFSFAGIEMAVGWLTHGSMVDVDHEGRGS